MRSRYLSRSDGVEAAVTGGLAVDAEEAAVGGLAVGAEETAFGGSAVGAEGRTTAFAIGTAIPPLSSMGAVGTTAPLSTLLLSGMGTATAATATFSVRRTPVAALFLFDILQRIPQNWLAV